MKIFSLFKIISSTKISNIFFIFLILNLSLGVSSPCNINNLFKNIFSILANIIKLRQDQITNTLIPKNNNKTLYL
jgi:hypothetical protein